jgi:hypothetical protein
MYARHFSGYSKPSHNATDLRKASVIRASLRGSYRWNKRDSVRQRSLDWENCNLRGMGPDGSFAYRDGAKGFARLCVKIALRRLKARHNMTEEAVTEVRSSFMARFVVTDERKSWGGLSGIYMASWAWTKVIIAHEVAHWIDGHDMNLSDAYRAGHGAEWMGWFHVLLTEAVGFTDAYLTETLAKNGLRRVMP